MAEVRRRLAAIGRLITFDKRGVRGSRVLKGVPGRWRLYAAEFGGGGGGPISANDSTGPQ